MAFGVPMLLLISHRGELGDERWFSVPFGWGTKPLLDSMRITHRSVEKTEEVSHCYQQCGQVDEFHASAHCHLLPGRSCFEIFRGESVFFFFFFLTGMSVCVDFIGDSLPAMALGCHRQHQNRLSIDEFHNNADIGSEQVRLLSTGRLAA